MDLRSYIESELEGAAGEVRGDLARPRGQDRPAPAVVVVHENTVLGTP